MDVGDFLRELGLQRYEAAFRENAIGDCPESGEIGPTAI
jgi:hypothetical protein